MKKRVLAITAALPAIIPNPVTPVISAIIINRIALRIMVCGFLSCLMKVPINYPV
jgi:hypothetical protein